MWMQSMTYDAMLQAFENRETGKPTKRSVMQRTPVQADWIIGMNGSRIATRLPQNATVLLTRSAGFKRHPRHGC